jgi:hypothetical protein
MESCAVLKTSVRKINTVLTAAGEINSYESGGHDAAPYELPYQEKEFSV